MTLITTPLRQHLNAMNQIVSMLVKAIEYPLPDVEAVFQHHVEQIAAYTAVDAHGYPFSHPVYKIEGDLYKIEPTSCRCGGTLAWLRERPSGAWEMVGCICHTSPCKQEPLLDRINHWLASHAHIDTPYWLLENEDVKALAEYLSQPSKEKTQ